MTEPHLAARAQLNKIKIKAQDDIDLVVLRYIHDNLNSSRSTIFDKLCGNDVVLREVLYKSISRLFGRKKLIKTAAGTEMGEAMYYGLTPKGRKLLAKENHGDQ